MRATSPRRTNGSRLMPRSRWLAATAAMAALPLLTAMAAPPANSPPVARPLRLLPVNPGNPVPVHLVASRPVRVPALPPAWHPAPARWPAAGTATVQVQPGAAALGSPADASAGGGMAQPTQGSARAGALPVWVGPAAAGGSPATVQVTMASPSAARAAGMTGVIFTISAAAPATATALRVSLDYSSFAEADGGSFGSRLRLVELPACALTTPQAAACRRQTPVSSANNPAADQLGTDITLGAAGAAASPAGASADAGASPATGSVAPQIVLAATTSTSGSQGSYSATPLSDTGSWTAGGSSGAFSYSYPVAVPPVPGGLTPPVAIGYNSQELDGLTSATNDQASWIGDGFDYQPGFIERDYETCSQDSLTPALPAADKTGDLCWSASNQTTLSLGGATTTLADDPANGWHAEADNGAQITYRSSATSNGTTNGTSDGGYWIVTEPDGTSYYFGLNRLPGWASGDTTTSSAWTVPVYSPRSADADGCYNATFSRSSCSQAWRWNLDYVTDANGNAMAYFYNTETNDYAADNATTGTAAYTQAGALATIWYGFQGTVYAGAGGAPAGAGEVQFATATTRTDVPTDLTCVSGASCAVSSPSFWSRYQLTGITTYGLAGSSMSEADSWALGQSFINPGDDTTTAPMVLSSITRTGEDGTAVSLPPVTFGYVSLPNRVETTTDFSDGYTTIPRERVQSVTNETGEVTSIEYDSPPASCASASLPTPDANTTLCYPQYWTPPGAGSPIEDWFNLYAVTMITSTPTAGGSPPVITSYCYGTSECLSGGAWHYNDDALTRSSQRTWSQWRGFGEVSTQTGTSPDPVTEAADYYFQGMNGDEQSGGGTASATLAQTIPGTSTTITATDNNQWAGAGFAHVTYDGAGGPVVSDTVTTPWTSAATASQPQPGGLPALHAYLTGTAETQDFTALGSGGYREADTTDIHDSRGRVTSQAQVPDYQDNGAPGDATEDTCTQTTYATDSSVFQTDLPAQITVTAGPPASCPASLPPAQAQLISDTRNSYDSQLLGTATSGNLTQTQLATSYTGSQENFSTQSAATYDAYGRVTSATDADGNTTTTSYVPSGDAEPTSATVTTPATAHAPSGLATTTAYDPLRELPVTITSPARRVTSETYDALGRLTAVWTPGHLEATAAAADKYAYSISATHPSVVTTSTITDTGGYNVSETIYDSAAQPVETQTATPSGGRDVTDTLYNSDGWKSLVTGAYYATGAPSPGLVDEQLQYVPAETGYAYDGDGRVIRQITDTGGSPEWETDTSYGGNYTTVTPPAGGTAQTTYANGDGQTNYIYQYHSSPPPSGPPAPGTPSSPGAGGWDETAYTYTPGQQLATITDNASNHWSYGYNLAGDQVSATTPDAGTTTSTYDADGNLLSATNAAGSTLSYAYDADGRKTAQYAAATAGQSPSNETASWTYDTLAAGMLTSSSSYTSGTSGPAYTEQAMGYDSYGLPTGTETIIPAAAGPLAATYKRTYGYNSSTGIMTGYYDYAGGGLAAESVSTGYDTSGNPVSMTSSLWSYVAGVSYTTIGQPQEYALGTTTNPAFIFDSYHPDTGALWTTTAEVGSAQTTVDDQTYNYDPDGLITSEQDTGTTGITQDQCYTYDYLGELTNAWTQNTATCPATPAASDLGGAQPYWQQLSYDTTGDITASTTTYGAPGSQTTISQANTYQANGDTGPHQLAAQATTATPGGNTTATQTYNTAGQLTATTSTSAGSPAGTLNWNGAGQLTSDTITSTSGAASASYIYDADGNLLLQTDNNTTTLYLADEQITNTGGTLSGTRYYTIGGVTIAAATSAGDVQYLIGNQQGTDTVAIDYLNFNVTRRYYTPFGAPAQNSEPAFPGSKGFVGGTTDTLTGLTNLGAREYNPANGQFITTDPILTPQNPQDLNPYAYAADNPATNSDPTGLLQGCVEAGHCQVLSAGNYQAAIDYGNHEQQTEGGWGDVGGGIVNAVYHAAKSFLPFASPIPGLGAAVASHLPARIPVGRPGKSSYTLGGYAFNIAALFAPGGELGDLADATDTATTAVGSVGARFATSPDGITADTSTTRFVADAGGTITDRLAGRTPNAVSLGRYPTYLNYASITGARAFNVGDAWEEMAARTDSFGGTGPGSEIWIRNMQFLDQAVDQGSDIVATANPADPANEGSFFMRELDYLYGSGE